jgi:hypothetical protein
MIEEDLDEDVDETIQHYARKKRESTNLRGIIGAIVIIIIVVLAAAYFILFLK